MERALEWLAAQDAGQPKLEQAAAAVDMSPYHFQRVFTRWAGVSPKQFLQALGLARAKQRLAQGANVFDASLDAGLSGPGRLHDAFVNVEAVTPGEYKSGLAGVRIGYGFHASPFGECLVMSTERGICALGFVGGDRDRTFADLSMRFPNADFSADEQSTRVLRDRIFHDGGPGAGAPLKLFLCGTRFQIQVWRALLEIPEGAFTSYEALARRVGNPKAVRAVGTANGANPISYLIPCHRVIRKTGALGGYHWGLGRKLAILGAEAARRFATPRGSGADAYAAVEQPQA
jgi:AraC family transcriptional regulator of adaptative response/methylated-DNA-[protein]-cysteine methyltransferase